MLIGEFKHNLDPKKRMAVPAKFRKEIGKTVVITKGLDKCLFVYPMAEWKRVAETLGDLPVGPSDARHFARLSFSGAVDVNVDSLGRVLIPDFLKEYAGLDVKAVVVGVHKRIEIWDEKNWEAYRQKIEKEADVLAEKLGEKGIY